MSSPCSGEYPRPVSSGINITGIILLARLESEFLWLFNISANHLQKLALPLPCSEDPNDLGPTLLNTNVIDFSTRVLGFAHKLADKLFEEQQQQPSNIVFSPLSIAGALQLIILGARGRTHDELTQLFGYQPQQQQQHQVTSAASHRDFGQLIGSLIASNSNLNSPEVDHFVRVANALFVDQGFSLRPDYKAVVQSIYRAETFSVDFRSPLLAQQANKWVEEATSGKIRDILTRPLPEETKMLVASTVYFNAKWKNTFFEEMTKKKSFWLQGRGNGEPVQVDMMAIGGKFPFYDAPEFGCKVLALPYKNSTSHMFLLVPNESSPAAVRNLHRQLSAESINQMIAKMTVKTSILLLPKMHLTATINLQRELAGLGVRSLFDPHSSDLGLLAENGGAGAYSPVAGVSGGGGGNDGAGFAGHSQNFSPFPTLINPQQQSQQHQFQLEDGLIFSRFNDDDSMTNGESMKMRSKRNTYKAASLNGKSQDPLNMKDFVLRKRITKENKLNKKAIRHRRQVDALQALDNLRTGSSSQNPGLFANEIVHKVDLVVNEKGTEGGAGLWIKVTNEITN